MTDDLTPEERAFGHEVVNSSDRSDSINDLTPDETAFRHEIISSQAAPTVSAPTASQVAQGYYDNQLAPQTVPTPQSNEEGSNKFFNQTKNIMNNIGNALGESHYGSAALQGLGAAVQIPVNAVTDTYGAMVNTLPPNPYDIAGKTLNSVGEYAKNQPQGSVLNTLYNIPNQMALNQQVYASSNPESAANLNAVGALGGALLAGKGKLNDIGELANSLKSAEIPISINELSNAKNLYKQGYESGAQYHPDLTSQIKNDIENAKPQETSARGLSPGDKAFAKELEQETALKPAMLDAYLNYKQPTFDIPSFDKTDKSLTRIINNHTDKFGKMDNYGQQTYELQNTIRNRFQDAPITSGNPQAADILNQARNRYFVGKKLEDIENITSKALGTQNPSSSLKTQINRFVNDPNRTRGLDPATIGALKDFAQNGIVSNVLGRTIGSKLLTTIAGASAGGVPGAIAGNLVAAGGKTGATMWDTARLNRIKKMIAAQQPKVYGAQ